MDINLIESLANIVKKTGLTGMEITEGTTKIRLEKNAVQTVITKEIEAPTPKTKQTVAEPETETEIIPEGVVDFNKLTEVRSPFVGVFYSAPGEGAEPYVKVGDKVKKGDVLCIVESMKLMNEITAETEGEIVDICVQNGQVVEFSQILFKIF